MSRKKVIVGNWKMYKNTSEAQDFFKTLIAQLPNDDTKKIIIAPNYTSLESAVSATKNSPIKISAQNMHWEKDGALTGEISAGMLKNIGVEYVLLGHSERRQLFNETDEMVNKKIQAALWNDIKPIVCIGESLEDRKSNKTFEILQKQLEKAFKNLSIKDLDNIIIAYEPIWAIGTGQTASPEMAQEVHVFIRSWVSEKFTLTIANSLKILYGGSVTPENSSQLLNKKDIDGALVGGASLKPETFLEIINF